MKKEQSRAIGLFFFLGFMDERLALSAASRVIAKLKADFSESSRKGPEPSLLPTPAVIAACLESWKVHRRQRPRGPQGVDPDISWCRPKAVNLESWSRYQSDASDEDLMTLLFSIVLSVSDEELAEGFQTSVGTIRYRLGRGVRQLGLVARGGSR